MAGPIRVKWWGGSLLALSQGEERSVRDVDRIHLTDPVVAANALLIRCTGPPEIPSRARRL